MPPRSASSREQDKSLDKRARLFAQAKQQRRSMLALAHKCEARARVAAKQRNRPSFTHQGRRAPGPAPTRRPGSRRRAGSSSSTSGSDPDEGEPPSQPEPAGGVA